jgi:hypothetical protein
MEESAELDCPLGARRKSKGEGKIGPVNVSEVAGGRDPGKDCVNVNEGAGGRDPGRDCVNVSEGAGGSDPGRD